MISRIRTYQDLVQYLAENQLPHRANPAELAVEVPVTTAQQTGVVYLRWGAMPQIVFPFLANIPESRVAELEAAIGRANTAVSLPGFGYEYEQRFVYMRMCAPTYAEGIPAVALQRLVLAVIENARQFAAAFAEVASGAPGKDILELARRHNAS